MPRLIQITDTHIYADAADCFEGVNTRHTLAGVLAHVRTRAGVYDALLATGDLAMDGSRAAYAHLNAELAAIAVPVIVLPGNHDEPDELARGAPRLHSTMPYCLSMGGWQLLCLDTRIAGCAHGEVDAAQLDWLARMLRVAPTSPVAIFMHHPPVTIGSPWMDAMGLRAAARFWAVLDGHRGVRVIACGHVHQNFEQYRAGVRVLTTPSTCVQFMPGARRYTADTRAPGYRVLELADDGSVTSGVVRVRV